MIRSRRAFSQKKTTISFEKEGEVLISLAAYDIASKASRESTVVGKLRKATMTRSVSDAAFLITVESCSAFFSWPYAVTSLFTALKKAAYFFRTSCSTFPARASSSYVDTFFEQEAAQHRVMTQMNSSCVLLPAGGTVDGLSFNV